MKMRVVYPHGGSIFPLQGCITSSKVALLAFAASETMDGSTADKTIFKTTRQVYSSVGFEPVKSAIC